jgi:sec-independent protein translocase protein TatA
MLGIGLPELLVILLIVVVIFGANRLPKLGEGLGKAIRGFKKGISDTQDETGKDAVKKEIKDNKDTKG